jgi:hypothetical protein
MVGGWAVVGGLAGLLLGAPILAGLFLGASPAAAGTIDTAVLEHPWPRSWVRELELGRYPVRWRQAASRTEGIFAGVRCEAPLPQRQVWELATEYQDLGAMTPGITAVRYLEQSPTRQVIQVDVTVLWKNLRLTFEVEQEPPDVIRFQLVNEAVGTYRGLCRFAPRRHAGSTSGLSGTGSSERKPASEGKTAGRSSESTEVELATWLQPARPVPAGLILLVERIVLLQGVREFLETCEARGVEREVEGHRAAEDDCAQISSVAD